MFVSNDHDGFELTKGQLVCARIQGVRAEEQGDFKFHALATISDDDLGPIRDLGQKYTFILDKTRYR